MKSSLPKLNLEAAKQRPSLARAIDNAILLEKHGALEQYLVEWCEGMTDEERLYRLDRKFRVRKGGIIQFWGNIAECWFEFDRARTTGRWWKEVKKKGRVI